MVERQGSYFRLGDRALAPMTLSEIARETGFHLSTVSRILNGLLIEGPNGIVLARIRASDIWRVFRLVKSHILLREGEAGQIIKHFGGVERRLGVKRCL
ncbi:helix-turn-helix domain-containing protein [Phaeobacter inhibens]|nr:helix-turn-helix domain-containing protein [Phaeobacter inhibens]